MVWVPVTECCIAIIAAKPPLESVWTLDGVGASLLLFWTNVYPSYVRVICELGEKFVPVILTPVPTLAVLVLSEIVEPADTVNRAECMWVPSVACTLWEPSDAVGTWNVVVKPPVEFEVIVVSVVLSQLNVIVVLGENVIPVTVTLVPTGPLDGASVSAVSL